MPSTRSHAYITVKCINASNQPRLEQGARYQVLLDVSRAVEPDDDDATNRSGYLVRAEGDDTAIPYLFKRSRFEQV